jgi:hypothetical protein
MADHESFVFDMVRKIESGDDKAAAMRFTEEASTVYRSELNSAVKELNGELVAKSLPTVYLVEDGALNLKEAWLDDGVLSDTPLYKKPTMPTQADRFYDTEMLSEHFEAIKQLGDEHPSMRQDRRGLKKAAEFLVNEALKLDSNADRQFVLQRASEASYVEREGQFGTSLNVVFNDVDGDGIRSDLSDVAMTYTRYFAHRGLRTERIDLYDPPPVDKTK